MSYGPFSHSGKETAMETAMETDARAEAAEQARLTAWAKALRLAAGCFLSGRDMLAALIAGPS